MKRKGGYANAPASAMEVSGLASTVRSLLAPLRPFHSLRVSFSPIGRLCIDLESDDILTQFGDAYFIGRHQWDPTPRFLQLRNGVRAGSWRTHVRHLTTAIEFRERFMRPEGWDNYVELYFWNRGKFEASICIRRAIGQPDFSRDELRLLKRLHPQLRNTIRKLGRNLTEQHELESLRRLIARFPIPLMVLDGSFAPTILNPPGQRQSMAWIHGPSTSQHLKASKHVQVHSAITTACAALKIGRARGEARRIVHPDYPGLSAIVENLAFGQSATSTFAVWFSESLPPKIDIAWRALLSPSEWEVVLQVSSGSTNREVAARLGKSISTIRAQLHAAFRKMGVRSRMALAARLHAAPALPPTSGETNLD